MGRKTKWAVGALVVSVLAGTAAWWMLRPAGSLAELRIATAKKGGTYEVLGGQLARILQDLPGRPFADVSALRTGGSGDNLRRLVAGDAEVALVSGRKLVHSDELTRSRVQLLSRLYSDVAHVIVRDERIRSLKDLEGKKVYAFTPDSGTRSMAKWLFDQAGSDLNRCEIVEYGSFTEAAEALVAGRLDAAVLVAGTPTNAVARAMQSGKCRLLDLAVVAPSGRPDSTVQSHTIPAGTYAGQEQAVRTVQTPAYLVCRSDLPPPAGELVLGALFDNQLELLLAHTSAQDIDLAGVTGKPPEGVEYHQGAENFAKRQRATLQISTGALGGRYHEIGERLELLLRMQGVRARVVRSSGSVQNLRNLKRDNVLAIAQYDTLLTARYGSGKPVYRADVPRLDPPKGSGMARVATLHEEVLHVIARRDAIPQGTFDLRALAGRTVCVGPREGGTAAVAQAALLHHDLTAPPTIEHHRLDEMIRRLHEGTLDAACFVSYLPSDPLKTLLAADEFILLSLSPKARARLIGPAFTAATIPSGSFVCQGPGEGDVQTVATRAVLVVPSNSSFDVEALTEAIFEGEAILGVQGGARAMAQRLPSLSLHPGARAYYQRAGHLPAPQEFDWLSAVWRTLAILVMVVAAYKGVIKLKRDVAALHLARRVFGVSLDAETRNSVMLLRALRLEAQDRVRLRWWQRGELDKPRWRNLHGIIEDRIREAKENLTLGLVSAIREAARLQPGDARTGELATLGERIWAGFEEGELESAQHEMLLRVLEDARSGSRER